MDVLETVVTSGSGHTAVSAGISPLGPVEAADDGLLVKENLAHIDLPVGHHMSPEQRVVLDCDPECTTNSKQLLNRQQ